MAGPFACSVNIEGDGPLFPTTKDGLDFLYVINQRINQTVENTSKEGNLLHTLKVDQKGMLQVADSRHLGQDGVDYHSGPQGVVTLDK